MQSDMFGTIKRTAQMARDAMAMAGGDVTKAVANLEAAKQRYFAKLQAGGYDENWYPVCLANEVGIGEVKGYDFLDGRVVVYRGQSGTAQVLSPFCRHRRRPRGRRGGG